MKKNYLKRSALCLSISAAVASQAFAQLEEVVVTARKVAESTQDVPIAITNFNAGDLEAQTIQNIADIENSTPSMTIRQGYGSASSAIVGIRGQVQTDGIITFDQSVGLYFDDVFLGRSPGALLNMVDVERIEVLKGPQGTLYGRNTTGGAVKIISKKADPEVGLEGFIKGSFGNYDLRDISGAINLPIVQDVWAVRIAAASVDQDGYTTSYRVDRATGAVLDKAETDDTDQKSVRVTSVWNISDLTALTVNYDQSETGDYGQLLRNDRYGDFLVFGTPFSRAEGLDFWEGYTDHISLSESEVSGYSAVLEHEFSENLATKLVFAHRETESAFSQDSDGGVGGSWQSLSEMDQEQDSIELQFIGSAFDYALNWTAGLFWFDEEGTEDTTAYTSFGAGPAPFIRYFADNVHNKSKSAFVNGTYDLTDDLSLQAGVRYTEDEKSMDGANKFLAAIPSATPGVLLSNLCLYEQAGLSPSELSGAGGSCTLPLSEEWNNVSWILGLDYNLTADVLVYGKISTGYRSGGFSLRGADAASVAAFDEETVLDYEIGFKGDFLDRRLRINAAYFHTQYDDLQLTSSTQVLVRTGIPAIPALPFPGTGVSNPADATYDGVELELKALLTDNFTLDLAASYLDKEFDDKIAGRGTVVANSPDWQFSSAGTYRLPVAYGEWLFRVDYSYRGEQYASGGVQQAEQFGDVGIFNARIGLNLEQPGINLALWGKNLTDQEYYDAGFYRGGTPSASSPASGSNTLHPAAPRMYGVEVRYTF